MKQLEAALPKKRQLEFLDWEMGIFFHFGIRTFYEGHEDWDGKEMPAEAFCPEQLDCESWIRTAKEAGMKYAILTCKHHDGFANWPSACSEYSVAKTPWRGGTGDVVREFTDACRKYGLKVGLYYSPAEAGFAGRRPEEYDDYFVRQITELLSNYGKIDYLWFDDCGSQGHEYDRERILSVIRGLQPELLIFNMWRPDTVWVGNEGGIAGVTRSSLVPAEDGKAQPDATGGSEGASGEDEGEERRFLPAECDFRMRKKNWFYSEYDAHTVKSVEELLGLYDYSVGNGANFLINIGPDRRGLLPEPDAARLLEFGRALKKRFADPLPVSVSVEGEEIRVVLEEERLVRQLVLEEDLAQGERIRSFFVAPVSAAVREKPCIYRGGPVGHKRIVSFPPVAAKELWIRVECGGSGFRMKQVSVF